MLTSNWANDAAMISRPCYIAHFERPSKLLASSKQARASVHDFMFYATSGQATIAMAIMRLEKDKGKN